MSQSLIHTTATCIVQRGREILVSEGFDRIEDVFTFKGERKHEIVLVHSGQLKSGPYENHAIIGSEEEAGVFSATLDLDDFSRGENHLCPHGLLELLRRNVKP